MTFHIVFCRLALFTLALSGLAEAGGFDNSGRPFGIIFDGEGKARELRWALSVVHPQIDISLSRTQSSTAADLEINNVVPHYSNREWGLRWDLSEQVSCALRAETPFRAFISYPDDRLSYRRDSGSSAAAPIDSRYDSESLSFACRRNFSFGKHHWMVFAGPKHQKVGGYFSSDLTENNVGTRDDLQVWLNGGSEWGYLAGMAYELPEIALRISLIYHNEIDYQLRGRSLTPVAGLSQRVEADAQANTLTPQSWQLALQSGVAEDWLAYSEFKWNEWSRVDQIRVHDGVANPLLSLYSNDTLDLEIGVIHRIDEHWRAGVSYSSSMKLGGSDLPPGVDSANLRDPQGKRHAITLGSKYWWHKHLATDVLLSANYLEAKTIREHSFEARIDPTWVPALKVGISWHP